MKYKVEPVRVADCDCPDCRAGHHLYELSRWQDDQWQFVGISLQSYASATECQQKHRWGIEFAAAADTWEDGTPILPPTGDQPAPPKPGTSGGGGRVVLDLQKLAQSAAALEKHWHP